MRTTRGYSASDDNLDDDDVSKAAVKERMARMGKWTTPPKSTKEDKASASNATMRDTPDGHGETPTGSSRFR